VIVIKILSNEGNFTSLFSQALKPDIKVFAVEPCGKELGESLRACQRLWGEPKFLGDSVVSSVK